ncbi:MAG: heparinase II/III family protein [Rhodocyclaceae bacterium]|nr:heparinase II/III family protein [Rhodocyclaceae bacterium]
MAKVQNVAKPAGGAMLVYSVTKDPVFLEIAKRRLNNLAALDPHAITGERSIDLASSLILSLMSNALDQMGDVLSSTEKSRFRFVIDERLMDFERWLISDTKIARNPRNPHGYPILGAVAAIATVHNDTIPDLARLCPELVETFLQITSPWGGNDGGSSQGTAYAIYDHTEVIMAMDTIRRASGVDVLSLNPFLKNFGRYMIYFQPPGSPSFLFGDSAEKNYPDVRANAAKMYVRRMPADPLYDWYDAATTGEDHRNLQMLMAPPKRPAAGTFPAGTPNGAVFNSIGWAAMHSDLKFRDRVSVYFKSSPYGTSNHAHSDQNGLVIVAKGVHLLADSGYYDYYGSPHHTSWTRLTKAHNAITYDGGKGQPIADPGAEGAITQFQTTADYDVVTGDARLAYGADITGARRSVAYLRPNLVVVFDQMTSGAPHKWEWNFHSVAPGTIDTLSGKGRVANSGVQACLQIASPQPLTGSSTTSFGVAPVRTEADPRPDQWHGKFETVTASNNFLSAVVIDVECASAGTPVFEFAPGRAVVRVAGKVVTFNGISVKVE